MYRGGQVEAEGSGSIALSAACTSGQVAEVLLETRAAAQETITAAHPASGIVNVQDSDGWGASLARTFGKVGKEC